jgi:hypothetical protein
MIPLLIPAALGLIGGYLSIEPKKYHLGGDMSKHLAPNGKPSKLTPEQYKLVRTPEFKAWFGDWERAYETGNYDGVSKVIDEETKEPLVVYHGTNIKVFFTIFNPKKDGIWVSSNKEIAKSYGNRIIEVFLNLRKPTTEKIWRKVRDKHYEENKGQFWQYDEFDIPHNEILELMYKNIRNVICKKGYDSIKLDKDFFEEGTENFIAFNSNQIKLADGTNTTFDAENPDIRYAEGGVVINNKKYRADEIVEEFDISGFNNKEDAIEEMEYLLEADFPYGFNNIPQYVILYRVILIEDGEKINEEEIGEHFIADKKMAYTLSFLEKIGVWDNWSDDSKLWLLECKTKRQNIDIDATIGNRLLYPRENEFTLINASSVTIINKKSINKKQIDKGL